MLARVLASSSRRRRREKKKCARTDVNDTGAEIVMALGSVNMGVYDTCAEIVMEVLSANMAPYDASAASARLRTIADEKFTKSNGDMV